MSAVPIKSLRSSSQRAKPPADAVCKCGHSANRHSHMTGHCCDTVCKCSKFSQTARDLATVPRTTAPMPPSHEVEWWDAELWVPLIDDTITFMKKVYGLSCGPLFLYEGVSSDGSPDSKKWRLVVVSVKLKCCQVSDPLDAMQIGEELYRRCHVELEESDPDVLRQVLPTWVVTWLQQCASEDRYIEPSVPPSVPSDTVSSGTSPSGQL